MSKLSEVGEKLSKNTDADTMCDRAYDALVNGDFSGYLARARMAIYLCSNQIGDDDKAFEYVIERTLKHDDNDLVQKITFHAARDTLTYMKPEFEGDASAILAKQDFSIKNVEKYGRKINFGEEWMKTVFAGYGMRVRGKVMRSLDVTSLRGGIDVNRRFITELREFVEGFELIPSPYARVMITMNQDVHGVFAAAMDFQVTNPDDDRDRFDAEKKIAEDISGHITFLVLEVLRAVALGELSDVDVAPYIGINGRFAWLHDVWITMHVHEAK